MSSFTVVLSLLNLFVPLSTAGDVEASMRRDAMSADTLSRSSRDLLTRSLSTERTAHRSSRSDHAVNLAVLGHSGVGKSGKHAHCTPVSNSADTRTVNVVRNLLHSFCTVLAPLRSCCIVEAGVLVLLVAVDVVDPS